MTQQEAKIAANKGEKITHDYFSGNEFVTVKDGKLIDENDYHLNWDEFWRLRSGPNWQKGWDIYKPK
jgi:hypothetical protein